MKRFVSIVAIVMVMVACVTSFAACSGNVDNIDKGIEKINSVNRFVTTLSETTDEYTKVTEVLISDDRMQVLSVKTILASDKVEKSDVYYDVLGDNRVREYTTFECSKHAKGGKNVLEWKFEDKDVPFNYANKAREELRAQLASFGLKSADLVWNKEAEGFVFADGKATTKVGASDVVVVVKSYSISISYVEGGVKKNISFMNYDTARVSFPILCKDYQDQLNALKKK